MLTFLARLEGHRGPASHFKLYQARNIGDLKKLDRERWRSLVPVWIDNVNPPRVERKNALGLDVDADYDKLLERMCRAYEIRWHT